MPDGFSEAELLYGVAIVPAGRRPTICKLTLLGLTGTTAEISSRQLANFVLFSLS